MPLKLAIDLVERGLVPDAVSRLGIRRLLGRRLAEIAHGDCSERRRRHAAFLAELAASPVAMHTDDANRQHYELPPEFFRAVLGPHLKYSACWWPEGARTLAEAEGATLELNCRRLELADGMRVLDLGCGWGSMSLWIAEHYQAAKVLAVSNSNAQREFILARCRERCLGNVEVVTADVAELELGEPFDRVVSVEMFEHLRNWQEMFRRIASWLTPDGQMLLHVFCHREQAYAYEVRSAADWMSEHFFTGGMMPSDDLPLRLQSELTVTEHWRLNGRHYSRTLEAWLERFDARRRQLEPLFVDTYGGDAQRWITRWRLFFMACSELFAYAGGDEWFVSQYRLQPRQLAQRRRATGLSSRPVAAAGPAREETA